MELKLDTNKEYGLVLEGGGAKGAYQIGAWKALKEAGDPCKRDRRNFCRSLKWRSHSHG